MMRMKTTKHHLKVTVTFPWVEVTTRDNGMRNGPKMAVDIIATFSALADRARRRQLKFKRMTIAGQIYRVQLIQPKPKEALENP
jgi:hypothetical protein